MKKVSLKRIEACVGPVLYYAIFYAVNGCERKYSETLQWSIHCLTMRSVYLRCSMTLHRIPKHQYRALFAPFMIFYVLLCRMGMSRHEYRKLTERLCVCKTG